MSSVAALEEGLDLGLLCVFAATGACFAWSYAAMPRVMPGEPRLSPAELFFGTGCLRYYRGPGAPPMTEADLPDSGGTEACNIDGMAALVASLWTPARGRLWPRLVRHLSWWWFYAFALASVQSVFRFAAQTFVYGKVLMYIEMPGAPIGIAIFKLQGLAFLIAVAQECVSSWANMNLALCGTDPIYAGVAMTVVRKMHRLSARGMMGTSAAEAQQLAQECYNNMVGAFESPIKMAMVDLLMCLYSLVQIYNLMGSACTIGAAVIIAFLTWASTLCNSKCLAHHQRIYESTLVRQSTMNVLLDNFKQLRLYNWMARAAKPLESQRADIRHNLFNALLWGSLGQTATQQIDALIIIFACLATVFLRGDRVDFTAMTMARVYMGTLIGSVMNLARCKSSWDEMVQRAARIERFLRLPERPECAEVEGPAQAMGATFAWPSKSKPARPDAGSPEGTTGGGEGGFEAAVLENVDLQPLEGELVLVSGTVGSGKSSLLLALLGELQCLSGELRVSGGAVVYQPQLPTLMDGTIRENVLFGTPDHECDEKRLRDALAAAQLTYEMNDPHSTLHAEGELTSVGRRGSHLSGGQRARTALAQCVYAVSQGAAMAVLDDPVASVDNEVVQAAWEEAVVRAMGGTTRIVAVNSQLVERLAHTADRLVLLKQGRVLFNGPPGDAMRDEALLGEAFGGRFDLAGLPPGQAATAHRGWAWTPAGLSAVAAYAQYFGNPAEGDPFVQEHLDLVQKSSPTAVTFESLAGQGMIQERVGPATDKGSAGERAHRAEDDAADATGGEPSLALANMLRDVGHFSEFLGGKVASPQLNREEWEQFRVELQRLEKRHRHPEAPGKPQLSSMETVVSFFVRGRGLMAVAFSMKFALNFRDPAIMWLTRRWATRTDGDHSNTFFLILLVTIMSGFTLVNLGMGIATAFSERSLRDSLYKDIDGSLTALGMPFFWKNSHAGETRLRKVVNTNVDFISMIVALPFQFIESFILVCITSYYAPSLWLLLPISALGFHQMKNYTNWRNSQLWPLRTQIQNSAWTKVVEQWDILMPLRSLKRYACFEKMLHKGIMVVTYTNVMQFTVQALVGLIQHGIGASFNFAAIFLMASMSREGTHPAVILAFWTMANNISSKISEMTGSYGPFQEQLALYRNMEELLCTNTLEPEEGAAPPPGWPREGRLKFEAVTFRYKAYLPAALRNVSFEVRPTEKLGVVGRTGSGKSTLVALLLRLGPVRGVAPSSGGCVLLDGVDVSTLKLGDLRSQIAVVPQEPTVFKDMSLKENVGEEFTDAEVLTALQSCGLDPRQLTGKGPLAEVLATRLGACSLSVGEQQLLMAARALVRRPKVLILDESTASLSRETADRLSDAINGHTADATVLSIAHRLRFVLKSDRVLVLSMGEVVAFDTPQHLLEQTDSYFAVNLRLEQQEDREVQ